jgi:hypothetical protein
VTFDGDDAAHHLPGYGPGRTRRVHDRP